MKKPILDADMISYEAMIASKEAAESALRTMIATEAAAEWAFYMLILTLISVVFSLVMLIYAFRALSTWREQEQLKIKVEFKKSLISMHDLLLVMPDEKLTFLSNIGKRILSYSGGQEPLHSSQELTAFYQKKALEDEFAKAEHNWAICEELFLGTKTSKDWDFFKRSYFDYAKLNKPKNGMCELLSTMKSDLHIFVIKAPFWKKTSQLGKRNPIKKNIVD